MRTCPNCGSNVSDTAKFCMNCGKPLPTPQSSETADGAIGNASGNAQEPEVLPVADGQGQEASISDTSQAQPIPPAYNQIPSQQKPPSSGKAIGALVCGILAIILSGSVVVGLVLGIVAIVIGSGDAKAKGDGKAKAGKVCGIIGIILSALALVLYVFLGLFALADYASQHSPSDYSYTNELTDSDTSIEEFLNGLYGSSSSSSSSASSSSDGTSAYNENEAALEMAQLYSDEMHMSKAGIYNQLASFFGDGFSKEAAQYAVDNVDADWNANALARAKEYQQMTTLTPEQIYNQLVSDYGDQFTPEEAQYAIDNL